MKPSTTHFAPWHSVHLGNVLYAHLVLPTVSVPAPGLGGGGGPGRHAPPDEAVSALKKNLFRALYDIASIYDNA